MRIQRGACCHTPGAFLPQALVAKTKRRSLKKKGEEKHLFSGMLYCADCGSKLWYRTNTNNNDIHFYSCCNYKTDTRGTCETRHYIRADAIEEVVRMTGLDLHFLPKGEN